MFFGLENKKYTPLLLSLSTGFLLGFGWLAHPILIFIAWIPFLALNEYFEFNSSKRANFYFFLFSWLGTFIWNLLTTWWIVNSTIVGASLAIILNSLLMAIPLLLYRLTHQSIGERYGYFALIIYWLGFEYLHLNWELAWPWLNLGNVFAFTPVWVQWYEVTGVLGGTLWILIVNIFIYLTLRYRKSALLKFGIIALVTLLGPLLISSSFYYSYSDEGKLVEAVVIQPNVDPYKEKFEESANFITFAQQVQRFIQLSEESVTAETQLIVLPEAALDRLYPESSLATFPTIKELKRLLEAKPNLAMLLGATTYRVLSDTNNLPNNIRYSENVGYYEMYNAAILMSAHDSLQFYHKSKLVPGVEQIPFATVFKPLNQLIIDLGGTSGAFGTQEERSILVTKNKLKIAPLICYESIFGAYVSDYIQNGAEVICIITNDAWWGNTAGYVQHFHYARLRAIETRKSVIRSANTGISGFINQRGDILKRSRYATEDSLRASIRSNTKETIYVRYGDMIGRLTSFIAIALLLTTFVRRIAGKKGISR